MPPFLPLLALREKSKGSDLRKQERDHAQGRRRRRKRQKDDGEEARSLFSRRVAEKLASVRGGATADPSPNVSSSNGEEEGTKPEDDDPEGVFRYRPHGTRVLL